MKTVNRFSFSRILKLACYLLVFFYCVQTANSQPVTLDPTFGQNGITEIPNTSDIHLFDFDNAGNIIAVGYTTIEKKSYLTIVKTDADGILDQDFGNNGIVYSHEAAEGAQLGLRITGKNKIFITGSFFYPELYNESKRTFVQFNEDGSVDETFGDHGKIIIDSGSVGISSLNIESDDFLLFGGYEANSLDPFILKRNNDGTLDETFGEKGIVYLTDHEIYNIHSNRIIILNDKTIFVVGKNIIPPSIISDGHEVAFCKISPNGDFVTEFANNGVWSMNIYFDFFTETSEYFADAIEDNKGNLTLLGTFDQIFPHIDSSFMFQFSPNGTINTDFGIDGFCNYFYSRNIPSEYPPRIVQNGNKYIVGGYNIIHSINLNGTIDESFNYTGSYSCQGFTFHKMKLQKETKLLLGGNSNGNFAIVRLNIPYDVSVKPDLPDEHSFLVYPNPTMGVLNLIQESINNEQLTIDNIEVFDIYGRKQISDIRLSDMQYLTSEIGKSEIKISIEHLPAGIYFVKITTEAGEVVKKVMKQ